MRVQFSALVPVDGKFALCFVMFGGTPGDEHVLGEVTSAAVFETEDAAFAGVSRAMNYFDAHGRFPNMCEPF